MEKSNGFPWVFQWLILWLRILKTSGVPPPPLSARPPICFWCLTVLMPHWSKRDWLGGRRDPWAGEVLLDFTVLLWAATPTLWAASFSHGAFLCDLQNSPSLGIYQREFLPWEMPSSADYDHCLWSLTCGQASSVETFPWSPMSSPGIPFGKNTFKEAPEQLVLSLCSLSSLSLCPYLAHRKYILLIIFGWEFENESQTFSLVPKANSVSLLPWVCWHNSSVSCIAQIARET